MIFVVDVGNTQTHLGLYNGTELSHSWRLTTVRGATCDELAVMLDGLFTFVGLKLDEVQSAIVSSTVPQLGPEWVRLSQRYFRAEMLAVSSELKTGIEIKIDNPQQLGPDRIVNAVAGYDLIKDACIIVDFGTAITFDVVSSKREYLGGLITPGVDVSIEALASRAAALSRVQMRAPEVLIGRNTDEAMRAGIIYGFAGQVDGIIERLHVELGDEVKTVATGGLSSLIVRHCNRIDASDPMLTLNGLRLIRENNV